MKLKMFALFFALVLVFSFSLSLPICAEENASYVLTTLITEKDDQHRIAFPYLTGGDSAVCDKINTMLQQEAYYSRYVSFAESVEAGSAGIVLSYDSNVITDAPITASVLSLMIRAEGKQPQGRPGGCAYTFAFDLTTGEKVSFDQLCTDADAARETIEEMILDVIQDEISDYMQFAALSPIPFDNYYCDGLGNITFSWDRTDFSFLSGRSGAVTLRVADFQDVFDTSDNSLLSGMLCAEKQPYQLSLPGQDLEDVLSRYGASFDSSYYPGGEAYTVQESTLRGAYLLTDENGETITGILFTALIPESLIKSQEALAGCDLSPVTAEDAEYLLVKEGTCYELEENGLLETYYFDLSGSLCAVRIMMIP